MATMRTGNPRLERKEARSLARGGLLNIFGAAATACAQIGIIVILARWTGPVTLGIFAATTSLFLILASAARLGTTSGLVYFITQLRVMNALDQIRPLLKTGLQPVIAASVVLSITLLAAAGPVARAIAPEQPGISMRAIQALALVLPAAALLESVLAATQGFRAMRPTVMVDKLFRPAAQLMGIGLVLVLGLTGAVWLVTAWALAFVPALIWAMWWLSRILVTSPKQSPGEATAVSAREFWRFTWPRGVSSLVLIALQRLDIVLVAAISGPVEAAVYTAATRFLVVGQLANQALAIVAQPRLGEAMNTGDTERARALFKTTTAWLVLLAWPMYLVVGLVGGPILELLGPTYAQGVNVIRVLAVTMLIASACGTVDVLLTMAGRTSWTLFNSLAALLTMVAIDLWLVPGLGAVGAAIGWSAAILVKNLLPLLQLAVAFRLSPFGPAFVKAALLTSVSFGALPLTFYWATGGSAMGIAAGLAGGIPLSVWWVVRNAGLFELQFLAERR